jgi:hypothetical protein
MACQRRERHVAIGLSGCMLSPRHGQSSRMGAPIELVAFRPPGTVFTFEYALHRFTASGSSSMNGARSGAAPPADRSTPTPTGR